MVHLWLMIEYEEFKANAIESITPFVFPWKINVENLDTSSNLEWLINLPSQVVSELPLPTEEEKEKPLKRGEDTKSMFSTPKIETPKKEKNESKKSLESKENESMTLSPGEAKIPTQQEVTSNKSMIGKIANFLKEVPLKNLFFSATILGDIPETQKKDLRIISETQKENAKKCQVPENEIIALLDLTLKGSAKNCLVFGEKGIYFHNSIFSKDPGRGVIPYGNFKNLNFELDGKYEINLGNKHYLNVSILGRKKEQKETIIEILNHLKTFSRENW